MQITQSHLSSQLRKQLCHIKNTGLKYKSNYPQSSLYQFLKTMFKRKNKEKPNITQLLLSQQIKYPLLYYADSLYPQNLHLLKSNEFKGFIQKMTKQLSPLLLINQSQFFTLLDKNLSIRTSLQSCLASFPRRIYSRFSDSRQVKKDLTKINDDSYKHYALLMKMVLFIFYRISSTSDKQDKQLVYNEFLLDIPKLLDIAAIYGQSNPAIVTKLIENAYKMHPSYDQDTMDFFNHVQHGKMEQMQRNKDTDIDFSPQSLNAQNYGNRQKYMIQKVMLTLFTVKDILFNLTNFLRYFPKRYVYELATDYKLQERLIDGVTFFTNQMNYGWNVGEYRQKYFKLHFEDMRQSMVIYFIEEFKILKEVILSNSAELKQFQEYAHNTYETFCLLLQTKKKPYYKEYVKLINNLIEEGQEEIFFLTGENIYKSADKKKANKKNKAESAIEYCQRYESEYRKKYKIARSVDFDPILNKNRENMKKFKETWIDPKQKKRNEFAKKRQEQYKKIQDYELNAYLNSLKYGGKSKQYDDQPQQQEFGNVVLPNQYQKLDKAKLNLSFVMVDPHKKIKYRPKYQASDYNQQNDLSFARSKKKNIDKNSLSFIQTNSQVPQFSLDLDISMVQPNHLTELSDLDVSHISFHENNEKSLQNTSFLQKFDEVFCWNDEQANEIQNFQLYLQRVNNKPNINEQDLSF